MAHMIRIDSDADGRKSAAVTRRLRGALAEHQIPVAEVARRVGVSQQALSRRMTGEGGWDIDVLDDICHAVGLSFDWIACGIRSVPDDPPPPPGTPAPAPPRRRRNTRQKRPSALRIISAQGADKRGEYRENGTAA